MDWTKIAIDKLCKYPDKKDSLRNIKAQLQALKAESTSVKGFVTDKIPTLGGGDVYSDKQLNIIVEMEELGARYNAVRKQIAPIEDALAKLTEDERYILDISYMHRSRNYTFTQQMDDKFHVEQAQAYRMRSKALKRFTLLLYGVVEE